MVLTIAYWNFVIRIAIFLKFLGGKGNGRIKEVMSKGMEFVSEEIGFSSIIISFFAVLSWYVRGFVYPGLVRKFHVRHLAISVVLLDSFVFVVVGVMLGITHYMVDKQLTLFLTLNALGEFLFNTTNLFFFIVLLIGSYVNQLLHTMFHQVGFAKLGRIMIGYYQKPREENLIFMFLDLKSSTTYAEKLGHERYSDFIQDCFKFITDPLLLTYGRVYQFVGDEVIVTWNATKEKNYKKAVDFFFIFQEELLKKREYFEEKYGLQPEFTASLNAGRVMAAEVGEIKIELAFHGDVLNTAARIQKQCKKFGKEILVTKNFAEKLDVGLNGYQINFLDTVSLVGKAKSVDLFEVRKVMAN